MQVQCQTLQHAPALLKGHGAQRGASNLAREHVRGFQIESGGICMGNELAIDGVEKGRAFTVAIHPLIVEEVAEFFHGVRRCLAKVAGVGWFHFSPRAEFKLFRGFDVLQRPYKACFDFR